MDYSRQFVREAKVAANDEYARMIRAVKASSYGGGAMAGKKDYDATKNVPEDEPTQVLPKGTKTGLPKRKDVFRTLEKITKKPARH